MIMIIAGFMFITIFTIFLPVETCRASGNTIYVDDGFNSSTPGWEETHFDNIQDAIDAARINESVDTIYVYGGTYNDNILIDTTLTLTGEDKDTTTISGVANSQDTVTIQGDSLDYISNVKLSEFTILQNPTAKSNYNSAIYIKYTDLCEITNCKIDGGYTGILTKKISESTISENTIEDNNRGIWITQFSVNNNIAENTISQNTKGIYIQDSANNNNIYHNTFQNNDQHAYDECNNQWDDGSEGNYWDDYSGVDKSPENGIGDTPYNISGGSNQDRYPLGFFAGENQKPIADAGGPYSGYAGQSITFDASGSTDSDGAISGYQWDFENDGNYDTGWLETPTTTHSYSNTGSYTVKLQVKDNEGETDTDTAQVTITEGDQKPTATIVKPKIASATYGDKVDFHGYGSPSEGTITEHNWRSSKDGFLSALPTFNKSDLSVGTHAIYFKVKDVNGWSDEASVNLVIDPDQSSPNEPPVSDAGGPYYGYVNVSLSFDASDSYDPDEEDINYSWDFGDGSIGYGVTVEHVYAASGTYTVSLTVKDNHGETSTNVTSATIIIQSNGQNGNDEENGTTPGFEILFFMLAVALILLKKNKKKREV